MYTIDEIKKLEPMKYWAFPPNSSANQKKRFAKALKEGYVLTLKRDGALYRAVIEQDGAILQSRTVSAKTGELVEKQDRVPHIMKELEKLPPNTVLMGEICFPANYGDMISSDVTSIMGCLAEKAIAKQKTVPLVYYVFDVLMFDGEPWYDKPYIKRMEKLKAIQKNYDLTEAIEFANPVFDNIEETVQLFLDNGWEGGVLMKADGTYDFGKRPAWNSIKIKQSTDTIDLVIMEVLPSNKAYTGKYPYSHTYWENIKTGELVEGRYSEHGGYSPISSNYYFDLPGGFKLGAYYGDSLIEVCRVANLTDELREAIKLHPDNFIGKVAEVSAMMVDVEKKSLRHPKLIRVREDKNAKECLYQDIFR